MKEDKSSSRTESSFPSQTLKHIDNMYRFLKSLILKSGFSLAVGFVCLRFPSKGINFQKLPGIQPSSYCIIYYKSLTTASLDRLFQNMTYKYIMCRIHEKWEK